VAGHVAGNRGTRKAHQLLVRQEKELKKCKVSAGSTFFMFNVMNPQHGPQQCVRNLFCLALGQQGEGILFRMLGDTRLADADERNRDSVRSHFLQTPPGWSKKQRPRECHSYCIAALSDIWYTGLADHAAGRSEAAQQSLLEADIARGIEVRKCRQNTTLAVPCKASQPVGSPMSRDRVLILRSLLKGSRTQLLSVINRTQHN
jgi:hypothetical protein